jgi:hypothetical protein
VVVEAVPAAVAVATDGISGVRTRSSGRRPHRLTVVVLLIGVLATAGLTALSRLNYVHNERRELSTQAQLTAAALAVQPVDIQRALGRATTLVSATGNVRLYDGALQDSLRADAFVSVRLFRMEGGKPHLVHSLGEPTQLDATSSEAQQLVSKAASSGKLTVTRVATSTTQRLGFAFAASTLGRTYVSYAEATLPPDRRLNLPPNTPLSDMIFAVYYGTAETSDALIETNSDHLPLGGDAARVPIHFGDQLLTAAFVPRTPLLGTFAAWVAWLIAGAGVAMTALMALLTEWLLRRRATAEQLAAVTGELYRTQRGVAETLQTALLPKHLPRPSGLAIATRYVGGTLGIDVGGDWYDVVDLPGNRVFFAIGDVSGRGLSAATMMSRLRHSMTAYAIEGSDPATVLKKVSGLIDLNRDEHFATALCAVLDIDTGIVTVANAGHPPLLRVAGRVADFVATPLGPPLGVGTTYQTADIALAAGDVLLAYTDGLVERREESIDAGLGRLRREATPSADLESLLDRVLTALVPEGSAQDDTAILGLQWTR